MAQVMVDNFNLPNGRNRLSRLEILEEDVFNHLHSKFWQKLPAEQNSNYKCGIFQVILSLIGNGKPCIYFENAREFKHKKKQK